VNVNIHHNAVTLNSSEGDELFSASPSGAGGVAFCTGADNYQFNNKTGYAGIWSTGDGGGVSHMGFIYNGSIQHNAILFNQSTNPTTPTKRRRDHLMSAPDTDPTCTTVPTRIARLGWATAPVPHVVDANLIMGTRPKSAAAAAYASRRSTERTVHLPQTPANWYSVRSQTISSPTTCRLGRRGSVVD